jgi:hypothetical protein
MTQEELVEKAWATFHDFSMDQNEAMAAVVALVLEEAAKVAERVFPRGAMHTYASENAVVYIAQERACELAAAAIRALGKDEP